MNNTKTTAPKEVVEIVPEVDSKTNDSWQPIEGETVRTLKRRIVSPNSDIDEDEWKIIKTEAISVLSKCVNPKARAKQETGLVVGYVQSGKTLSFTTVAALARDNGYRLVIVITGTSVILSDQSTQRLEENLDLYAQPVRWYHCKSRDFNKSKGNHTKIKDALDDWKYNDLDPWERRTVLITVMKHHQHLKNLTDILSKLGLSNVPTLVIDDEGDQASLNTMVQKEGMSPTYQYILSLRKCLLHHTFLQYTATPQALLLINLIDVLSPNFVTVLSPGSKYTGGKAFFQDAPDQICAIPDGEILTNDQQSEVPPDSLLEAMRIFFLGVSAGRILGKTSRWSMMVHPSHKTIEHKQYIYWINNVKNNWSTILAPGVDEIDRQDLLEIFEDSYSNLQKTVPDLLPFEELSDKLSSTIRMAEVHEVNASHGRTLAPSEFNAVANILVGGQAMDRGFTVPGLTVTYMPRGKGVGNADTIQQRARFFGYKKDVFEYCRVFLETRVLDAYRNYIIHEEDVRERLIAHSKTGKSLDEWKRAFFLDKTLKPTRQNVLDIGYFRVNSRGHWYDLKAPHDSSEANRVIVQEFLKDLSFKDDKGHPERTTHEIHHEGEVSLKKVCEELLLRIRVTRLVDTQKFTGMHLQIAHYLDSHPDALCTVFHMSRGELRNRSLHKDEVVRLYQGRNQDKYLGDKSRKTPGRVTVQIHRLSLEDKKNGNFFPDVPTLAVWIPKDLSPDSIVQSQGEV